MKKQMIVGITGRSGSGKSCVAQHYAALGFPVEDGDVISREVTGAKSECLAQLVQEFGLGILHQDGTLNRRKLAEIAFSARHGTQKLVSITHPFITRELLRRAELAKQAGNKLFFIDGAVIIGAQIQQYCDKIIVVVSEQKLSVSRIILRDGISKTAAIQRLNAQLPEQDMIANADYVIENNSHPKALQQKADAILQDLLKQV